MKKLISLLLSAVILFTFAACGDKITSDSNAVDLEYYAKQGKIPECEYKLGAKIDEIKNELSAEYENSGEEDIVYNVTEGENNVLIDTGNFLYYYAKKNEANGISCIVDYGAAFGFEIGTVSIEIKKALKDYKCTEEAVDENNVFFMTGLTNATLYRYNFESRTVLFVFQDNALFATVMYDSNYWTQK